MRRPPAGAPNTAVFLEMSQVLDKDVITRTSGRNLGKVGAMWVDPVKREVVSLDLDEKKTIGSTKIGNIPLSALRQIGDVVLVHDEAGLYEADLDGRYGYVVLNGMEVRTRSGDCLGKVRRTAGSAAFQQACYMALCKGHLAMRCMLHAVFLCILHVYVCGMMCS